MLLLLVRLVVVAAFFVSACPVLHFLLIVLLLLPLFVSSSVEKPGYGLPDLLWPRPLTWPIWADLGRARPILANFAHPPWLGRFGPCLGRFLVGKLILVGPSRFWPTDPQPQTALRRTTLRRTALCRTAIRRTAIRRTALCRTAQYFALFFSFSHTHFHSFFLSLGGPFVEFLKCARLEFSPAGRRGLPHDNLRAKTSTLEVSTDQNTTKIPREDPQREEERHEKTHGEKKKTREDTRREKKNTRRSPEREKKNENGVGEGKKREILGLPPFGPPPFLPHPFSAFGSSHPSAPAKVGRARKTHPCHF